MSIGGKKVTYLAVGGDVPHFGLLGKAPSDLWLRISRHLNQRWKNASPQEKGDLTKIDGCLEKLRATLLQAHRLALHHKELLDFVPKFIASGGQYAAFRGDLACADFEGLLLHGRAALDRLTWFTSSKLKNSCSSFRKLPALLESLRTNKDAGSILHLINQTGISVRGVYVTIDSEEALRDLVSHKHSILEGTTTCFGLSRTTDGRVLMFDCEFTLPGLKKPMGVFHIGFLSISFLSFTVLNILAVLVGEQPLSIEDFKSTVVNRTVLFSDYVVDEPDGSPFGENALLVVRRMHPDGFEVIHRNMQPALWEHAQKV